MVSIVIFLILALTNLANSQNVNSNIDQVILGRSYRGGGIVDCRFTYCNPKWLLAYSCDQNNPCPDGSCCSYRGFCGKSDEYCLYGCQSNCKAATTPATTLKIPPDILKADLPPLTQPPTYLVEETVILKNLPRIVDPNPGIDDEICGYEHFPGSVLVPWQVRLRIVSKLGRVIQCSGVLLNSRTFLTSARCVQGAAKIMAYLGDYDTQRYEVYEQNVSCHFSIHPQFNGHDSEYDLAIATPCPNQPRIEYSNYIRPICLPAVITSNRPEKIVIEKKYRNATLSGWGKTGPTGNHWAFRLDRVRSRILWPDMCKEIWKHLNVTVQNTTLCTLSEKCRGDIGSPLFGYWNRRAVLIGITSFFNADCGKPHTLAVYADIIDRLSWIRQEAKGSLHFIGL